MPEENQNQEKKYDEKAQLPSGDYLVIPAGEKLARNEDFMDALFRFQYGTAEESDKGFEQMKKISEEGELEEKTES